MFSAQLNTGINCHIIQEEKSVKEISVDNLIMKDSDLFLLDQLTPEQFQEFANLIDTTNGNSLDENTSNFNYISTTNLNDNQICDNLSTCRNVPDNKQSFTSLLFSPISNNNKVSTSFEVDPFLADPSSQMKQDISSPTYITEGRYSPFSISSPASNISAEEGMPISALSEALSASHGSGGTVTIRKISRENSSKSLDISDPLAKLFESMSPPQSSQMYLNTKTSKSLDSLLDPTSVQVDLISGSGTHSDDEEITDDFNWDRLL